MGESVAEPGIAQRLVCFIRDSLLPDDLKDKFTEETLLLDLGVLDSLKTAALLKFIRDDIGTPVPPSSIEPENFKDVRSMTAMISNLTAAP